MCVSSPVYPVIIGNVRCARQILPDPDWKAEDQREPRVRTSGDNNNYDDNKGGDMPSWMFKEESNRGKTKKGDLKKNPDQLKKNDKRATHDVKVQEGNCVAGPCLTSAQAEKTDKIHPLKFKEAMSGVDRSTTEDLQKKESTLKKCFDQVGNRLLQRTMLHCSSRKMDYFIGNIKRRKREEVQTS